MLALTIEHDCGDGVESCVVLTVRPQHLPRYAGQVALPGGRREPRDADLQATALRETNEEIGVAPANVTIERELDWHSTTIGDCVKPFVGRARGPQKLVCDEREVERVLFLPRAQIVDKLFERREIVTPSGERHQTLAFTFDGALVWGLTARILHTAFVAQPE